MSEVTKNLQLSTWFQALFVEQTVAVRAVRALLVVDTRFAQFRTRLEHDDVDTF